MANKNSDSGRTTVDVDWGEEGAVTVVVSRDRILQQRIDLQKEERPVDLRKTRPGLV